MSRLCRLKSATHGKDGAWANSEIIRLRKENAALHKDSMRYQWLKTKIDVELIGERRAMVWLPIAGTKITDDDKTQTDFIIDVVLGTIDYNSDV